MQVFTLKQEFGNSADNLDYEYMTEEKCGKDKETETVSVSEMLYSCGCVHISMCVFNFSVQWGFLYLLAKRALQYVTYEHHVSVFPVYMKSVY